MIKISKQALALSKTIQTEINRWEELAAGRSVRSSDILRNQQYNSHLQFKINEALEKISKDLSDSYIQIYNDLQDPNRVSWAGTAHEIREILTNLLRLLAPDAKVIRAPWYKQLKNALGPTQKQRVKYILTKRGAGSKETGVVEQVANLDQMIEDLVRSTYKRASDAAHRYKTKIEVSRILRYFETFSVDLLDINI